MTMVHLAIFSHVFTGESDDYINISLKDPIFTFSGHFVRLLLKLGAAQHWQFDIQRRADAIVCSIARVTIDGVSGCGVTRYREELRIFVKL